MSAAERLKTHFGSEIAAMNALQERGLVSDNAVWLDDCALSDLERAAEVLGL